MYLLIHVLEGLGVQVLCQGLLEVGVVLVAVLLLEPLHVVGHIAAIDVVLQGLGIQLLGLCIIAHEALVGVGDVQAAVQASLQK